MLNLTMRMISLNFPARVRPLLFSLAVLTLACKKEPNKVYTKLNRAEFSGLSFPIPANFVETSLDELADAWRSSSNVNDIKEGQLQRIDRLRPMEGNFSIYADTTDVSNTVMVFTGPYVKIGKYTSKQLFLMLEKQLRSEAKELGIDFKPIENTHLTLKNTDILKIKFEWHNKNYTKIGAQYLVTAHGFTFGIVVTNDEDDFESLVRKVSISNQ